MECALLCRSRQIYILRTAYRARKFSKLTLNTFRNGIYICSRTAKVVESLCVARNRQNILCVCVCVLLAKQLNEVGVAVWRGARRIASRLHKCAGGA